MHCYLMTSVPKSAVSYHLHNHHVLSDSCLGSAHLWCDRGWLLSATSLALQPCQALVSRPKERVAQGSLPCVLPASYLLTKTVGPPPAWDKREHLQQSHIHMSLSAAWLKGTALSFSKRCAHHAAGVLPAQAACCTR